MAILDFAGVNQATVSFITNYGHRIYSDDFVHQMDECFGLEGDFFDNQTNPLLTSRFFANALDFDDATFDGALVWDSLQFAISSRSRATHPPTMPEQPTRCS